MTDSVATPTHPIITRNLLTLQDLTQQDVLAIIKAAQGYARNMHADQHLLNHRICGIFFTHTSTRTRTAFSTGALRLGAQIMTYGPNDLQLNTGESFQDTGKVLSHMLDALVIRTAADPAHMWELASNAQIPIINAMHATEHPTQALADLSIMDQKLGSLTGLRLLYLGEGNNTTLALALALAKFQQTTLYLCCPPGYGLKNSMLAKAVATAKANGSRIIISHINDLPTDIDVVYTTRWQTTGTSKQDLHWQASFIPFQVNHDVMTQTRARLFMHDLPAHRGQEVTASVIDGPHSIVFEQCQFKLFSAMAILKWIFGYI